MQNYMNSESGNNNAEELTNEYYFFVKTQDIRRPSQYFVFLDEKPSSINDGLYELTLETPPITQNTTLHVQDMPSQAHNNSCGFGFTDGHSELHQWRSPEFQSPIHVPVSEPGGTPPPVGWQDEYWIETHATDPLPTTSGGGGGGGGGH